MELQQVAAIDVGRNGGESLYFHDVDMPWKIKRRLTASTVNVSSYP